ncbi:EthD family reductase [Porphyrobacter sp. CACIAM 03H1]|uniref:EthD family reductase n=1 Tax=Porphyrobacter sp. CACIAM 03H1 TaxID=2003315 RepID=UPI000B5AB9DE|nr:EthD family reductase [Porphyrobacter sp. CACIAM 03H1]ASJ90526.1 ethyl tert-butyl ether degradation protein EthD [Porphyrobacter sp. CACIAM 03H1]
MANLVVSYPQAEGARFDAAYYRETHIPLVEESWGGLGLTGAEILWPADAAQPAAAMVVLRFADSAAIDTALASPATAAVMADIANFTDIQPSIYRTA